MSIAKIVPKPTVIEEIRAHAIKMLEDALEQAKAGNISCLIIITRDGNGHWGVEEFSEAIGKIEIMKHSWIEKFRKDGV